MRGVMFGAAVGDALGLPAEGLSPERTKKFFHGRWRHRFLLNRGMVSDDTDHLIFTAQSLLAHPDSKELFARRLAWRLRLWLLTLPAGIGFATLRSILRLWVGVSPSKSGVFSAGNGPAMRCGVIGAFFAHSPQLMDAFIEASTVMTHTDPRALVGAKAAARLIGWANRASDATAVDKNDWMDILLSAGQQDLEWVNLVRLIDKSLTQGLSVQAFAETLGLSKGVTGYMFHTVPVAVYACYKHAGSFQDTLESVFNCGGDTDTTGAIAGALCGAMVGEAGIPQDWIRKIWSWPMSQKLIGEIADRLALASVNHGVSKPARYFWPGFFFRNAVFLTVVLIHGFRRLLPPY
jgi:ADP-ribosylglycohydrolase